MKKENINSKVVSSSGFSVSLVVFIVLVVLKLFGVVNISWIMVFVIPFILVPVAIALLVFLFIIVVMLIAVVLGSLIKVDRK